MEPIEFTNNLIIDNQEKNPDAISRIRSEWERIGAGGCVERSLGNREGDYALECKKEGRSKAVKGIRVEAKWLSNRGPGDLFSSTTTNYNRLKAEFKNLKENQRLSLFVAEGNFSDLKKHKTPGDIGWDKVLSSLFSLNAKFRVPMIFSDRAPSWICSFLYASMHIVKDLVSGEIEGLKEAPEGEPREFILCKSFEDAQRKTLRDKGPGTQFFIADRAPGGQHNRRLSRLMALRGYGFWFFDKASPEELERIANQWLEKEKKETALIASGGFPPQPSYDGVIKILGKEKGQYLPKVIKAKDPETGEESLSGVRKKRKATVIFKNEYGDNPLYVVFEPPKSSGSCISILTPERIDGTFAHPKSINSMKELDPHTLKGAGKVKDPLKNEVQLIPDVLRSCHQYWKKLEEKEPPECGEPSKEPSISSDPITGESLPNVPDAKAPEKSGDSGTKANKEEESPASSHMKSKPDAQSVKAPEKSSKGEEKGLRGESLAEIAEEKPSSFKKQKQTSDSSMNQKDAQVAEDLESLTRRKTQLQTEIMKIQTSIDINDLEKELTRMQKNAKPRPLNFNRLRMEFKAEDEGLMVMIMGTAKSGKTSVAAHALKSIATSGEDFDWIRAGEFSGWVVARKIFNERIFGYDIDEQCHHVEELWSLLDHIKKAKRKILILDSFDGACRWMESILCQVDPKRLDRKSGLASLDRDGHGQKLSFTKKLIRKLGEIRAQGTHIVITCGAKTEERSSGLWTTPDLTGQAINLIPRDMTDIGLISNEGGRVFIRFDRYDGLGNAIIGSRSGFRNMKMEDLGKALLQFSNERPAAPALSPALPSGPTIEQAREERAPEIKKALDITSQAQEVLGSTPAPGFVAPPQETPPPEDFKGLIIAAFQKTNLAFEYNLEGGGICHVLELIKSFNFDGPWAQWFPIHKVAVDLAEISSLLGWMTHTIEFPAAQHLALSSLQKQYRNADLIIPDKFFDRTKSQFERTVSKGETNNRALYDCVTNSMMTVIENKDGAMNAFNDEDIPF